MLSPNQIASIHRQRAARQLRPDLPVETVEGPPLPRGYVVGVDLGQSRDYTAVVVNERAVARRRLIQPAAGREFVETAVHHRFTFLHRFPLGTPYPDIVLAVRRLLAQLPERPESPILVADATGVGRPVLDSMRREGLHPVGVTITGGIDAIEREPNDWRVPKRVLAAMLQVALQAGRLKIAGEMALTPVLTRELEAFKVKINVNGGESFEAWREQDHDDLVLASAMAVWGAETRREGVRSVEFRWMDR